MKNEQILEAMFDAALKQGLRDVVAEEQAELNRQIKESKVTYAPTKKHVREARKLMRKFENKHRRAPVAWTRAIAALLVVTTIVLGTFVMMPDVRAAFFNTVMGIYDKYIAVRFTNTPDRVISVGKFTMGYVPEGYRLVEKSEASAKYRYVFTNESGDTIRLSYQPDATRHLQYDFEFIQTKTIYLNDQEVLIFYGSDKLTALWQYDNYCFSITCPESEYQLKKIIENIS